MQEIEMDTTPAGPARAGEKAATQRCAASAARSRLRGASNVEAAILTGAVALGAAAAITSFGSVVSEQVHCLDRKLNGAAESCGSGRPVLANGRMAISNPYAKYWAAWKQKQAAIPAIPPPPVQRRKLQGECSEFGMECPNPDNAWVGLKPQGGPYPNRKIGEDKSKGYKFDWFGQPGLPNAAAVLPQSGAGGLKLYYPQGSSDNFSTTLRGAGSFFEKEFEFVGPGGKPVDAVAQWALFVVVKDPKTGKFQLRIHPDNPSINGSDRPNHSQLVQWTRWPLMGGKPMEDVYAAGEMMLVKYKVNGQDVTEIVGIVPKTGHFYNGSSSFNSNIHKTTVNLLHQLGYKGWGGQIRDGDETKQCLSNMLGGLIDANCDHA